jgi:hypothetical protein
MHLTLILRAPVKKYPGGVQRVRVADNGDGFAGMLTRQPPDHA